MRTLLAILLTGILVACGSSENTPPANQNIPTANGGKAECKFEAAKAGNRILFIGTQGSGTDFPEVSKDYFGTVKTVFGDGSLEIQWEETGVTKNHSVSSIQPEGICTPDITGKRVVFKGTQGSGTDFPEVSRSYFGKLIKVYASGIAEIDWDHLSSNTAESFSSIAIEQ